ncbi:MAG: hypothetical protein LAT51_10020 [Flavobacteriaceae bacterium]|nr:hypothetical protein [Flavobacteriaceae bacterium]
MRSVLLKIVLPITFFLYVASWFIWGNQKMIEHALSQAWLIEEIDKIDSNYYGNEYPYSPRIIIICDYIDNEEIIDGLGKTRKVISNHDADYFDDQLDDGVVLLIAISSRKFPNPILQYHGYGYWLYGTDHLQSDNELLFWFFNRWVKLYSDENLFVRKNF